MPFSDGVADFRSDTVTRPTDEMRAAMAAADVGDDVYGEDPTVNLLQERAAELVGHEAALFVPSGTMGNQIGIAILARPGDGVVCVETAHIRRFEAGGLAANSGVETIPVPSPDGGITVEQIERVNEDDAHLPSPAVLAWENSHNMSGGRVIDLEMFTASTQAARRRGWSVHLDGARIFNAAVAAGVPVTDYTRQADTVQFCLSKALGAPVGSILAGSRQLIDRAVRVRKRLGGGMRQAGIVAAGGLVALDHRADLVADHALAARLAKELHALVPDAVDPGSVVTNIVLVDQAAVPCSNERLQAAFDEQRVKVAPIAGSILRFVTHRDVGDSDVERVVAAFRAASGH